MNIVLNCCLALLVGNLGFRFWSYFVTMEVLRKVEKDVAKFKQACNDNKSDTSKVAVSIASLEKNVLFLEGSIVSKHWELQRRLEEKLTKMEARLTSKKKCSPHKPKRKEEDK